MQQLFLASGAFVCEILSIYFSTSKLLVNISPKIPFIFPRTLIHFRDVRYLLYLRKIFMLKNIFLFIEVKFYIYIFICIFIFKWISRIRSRRMKIILSIPSCYIINYNIQANICNKYVFLFLFKMKDVFYIYISHKRTRHKIMINIVSLRLYILIT